MKDKVNISIELLMLNDLFHNHVIDKEIYEQAVTQIQLSQSQAA